ncbi:UDP-2,3-diacylglucosamine diphosphatase [Candidatus Persebacteraceae bacterium Df01]|uniref:UDP-2,3-diacylglucosamine hydrolase n=1 Tax=Candidatus Doriopsillibacter californiensis TaxID=2970740 RepID=A0ABT7QJR9_9GAMM|nr:UDP-2,3-diacylglucosamine diphosphatase [Candidatus Persebacteraceae bacterium Df01]
MSLLPRRLAVADVHLSAVESARTTLFYEFLRHTASQADELYLLGDIFDVWLGDNDNSPLAINTVDELAALSASGVRICIQHGNRDFLLGARFCKAAGAQLLPDEYAIAGMLLMHGDTLCANAAYLRYRQLVHSTVFVAISNALPLTWRQWLAQAIRRQSQKRRQPATIDHSQATAAMQRHNCTTLVHGHTHTPELEKWTESERSFTRCCLPDWETAPGYADLRSDDIEIIHINSIN